jgi:heptosyltransferase-2
MVVQNQHPQLITSSQCNRVLVFLPGWVGDVVMATAALAAIRQRFSQAHVVHVMRSYVADVLAGTNLSDGQIFWPDHSTASPPRSTDAALGHADRGHTRGHLDLIRRLKAQRFDLAVLLTNSFRSALVARLSGIRQRVGYARDWRGWLLTDRLYPPRRSGRFLPIPALDYYNELAKSVGCEAISDQLLLQTTPEDELAIDRRLGGLDRRQPLVVLNPGANFGSAKCWPAEKYAALADEITTRYGARVVASLGPKEQEIAQRLGDAARQPLDIFIDPPLGLGPLRALIKRCQLLVTNDTGPRHFAAAFGVPVVTVFGSSDPAWTDTRYANERIVKLDLECQPCMKRTCPLKHHNCMRQLEPQQVLEKVDEFLAARHTVPDPGEPRQNITHKRNGGTGRGHAAVPPMTDRTPRQSP